MRPPLLFAAAAERGRAFVAPWRGAEPEFCCVLAHTDTCVRPGLSAAGISDHLRPLTPAADAEVVLLGQSRCLPALPSHPSGAAGPSGITRAALRLAGIDASFVGVGLRTWPAAVCRRLSEASGGDIAFGRAVPEAKRLFELGLGLGAELARESTCLVVGESVPGGTTTALALLLALGYAADGRVSGSGPGNARHLKSRVAHAALRAAGLSVGGGRADPLGAVAAIGDPMQPVVCGVALAAAEAGSSVLLAGGSQMVGVAALLEALRGPGSFERIAIGTTRWVVDDGSADVQGLASEVSPLLAVVAANLDFSSSRHAALHAYEHGMVKEGVGAGGAAIAALLATGLSAEYLEEAIDQVYDELLGRLN
ncbi:MAG TPA: TIGR00303 family protein [Chloroflexota bacterium]|jgi:uncharacterized protein (TIGR00303 family)|nr:TIGR00303 family protein [Chloroflexota bacterium]